MDGALIAQWAATVVLAGGFLFTIRRNSKGKEIKDTELKTELKGEILSLREKLDDPNDGLKAIKKSVDDQRLHCAKISTALKTKVNGIEQELDKKGKK